MNENGRLAFFFGKTYHWTYNRRGKLTLHKGNHFATCRRVHYNKSGEKQG